MNRFWVQIHRIPLPLILCVGSFQTGWSRPAQCDDTGADGFAGAKIAVKLAAANESSSGVVLEPTYFFGPTQLLLEAALVFQDG